MAKNGTQRPPLLWWYSQSRNKKIHPPLILNLLMAQAIIQWSSERRRTSSLRTSRPGTSRKMDLGWEQLSAIKPGNSSCVRVFWVMSGRPLFLSPWFCLPFASHWWAYVTCLVTKIGPPVRVGVKHWRPRFASTNRRHRCHDAMHHLKSKKGTGKFIDVALYESVFRRNGKFDFQIRHVRFYREPLPALGMPGIAPLVLTWAKTSAFVIAC